MLTKILEELVTNKIRLNNESRQFEEKLDGEIAHAQAEIEKLVPEEIKLVEDDDDERHPTIYNRGWNACREETLKNFGVKE